MDDTPTNTHRRKLLTGAVTLAAAAPLMAGLSACGAASEPETKATAGATAATTTPVANTTPLTARRTLGTLEVSAVGLGVQNMHRTYQTTVPRREEMINIIRTAFERGVTFFDCAEAYGPFENERILGEAIAPFRDQVVITSKFGWNIDPDSGQRGPGLNSRPAHVKRAVEGMLKRLRTDRIDLLYQHRVDPQVPIEDTVGAMADLVRAGKVKALGLSEAGAETIRKAHAVHPIAAVQSEYSLWTRDVEENGVLETCRSLGIGFVPFSPLGRGVLTGALKKLDGLSADDFRRSLPRFDAENFDANLALVALLEEMAKEKGVAPAQLALAWVLAQGDFIVPIPGASKVPHLEQNAAAADVALTKEEAGRLGELLSPARVAGGRYPQRMAAMANR